MIKLPDYGIFEDYRVKSYLPETGVNPASIYFGLTLTRFGFLHWLNSDTCSLVDTDKQLLHFFRSNDFSVMKMVKNTGLSKALSKNKVTELGDKLIRAYPNYQKWLINTKKLNYLKREPELRKSLLLNVVIKDQSFLDKQSISNLQKAGIPSLHYLLLTHSSLQIMTKELLSPIQNEKLYRKLIENNCPELWEIEPPFFSVFADFMNS